MREAETMYYSMDDVTRNAGGTRREDSREERLGGPELSVQDIKIVTLFAQGQKNADIADKLHIPLWSLKKQVYTNKGNLLDRLGVEGVPEAVILAANQGIISPKNILRGYDYTLAEKLSGRDQRIIRVLIDHPEYSLDKLGEIFGTAAANFKSTLSHLYKKLGKNNHAGASIAYMAYEQKEALAADGKWDALTDQHLAVSQRLLEGESPEAIADGLAIPLESVFQTVDGPHGIVGIARTSNAREAIVDIIDAKKLTTEHTEAYDFSRFEALTEGEQELLTVLSEHPEFSFQQAAEWMESHVVTIEEMMPSIMSKLAVANAIAPVALHVVRREMQKSQPTVSEEKPRAQKSNGKTVFSAETNANSARTYDPGMTPDEVAQLSMKDPVRAYLNEIGRVPLLSAAEEVALAIAMEKGKIAQAELTHPSRAYSDDERGAFRRDIAQGEEARQHMVRANLRLVVSVAKKYHIPGMEFFDHIQDGNEGLLRAVETFDYTRGNRFSTPAVWRIRQAITRSIALQGREIRLPDHIVQANKQIGRVEARLAQQLDHAPEPEEIAKEMGISVKKLYRLLDITAAPVSLSTKVGDTDESELGDFVEHTGPSPVELAAQQLLREQIEEVLMKLPERDRKIVQQRYGLVDGRYRTLEEVGKEFGVTRERIRQIEARALEKLRYPNLAKKLQGYLE